MIACQSAAADALRLMPNQAWLPVQAPVGSCFPAWCSHAVTCSACATTYAAYPTTFAAYLTTCAAYLTTCAAFLTTCAADLTTCAANLTTCNLQVEAEYGRLKITVQQRSKKLVITASAPHRTFDLWSLPTTQGFQDKGIQTFSGTAAVEAFEHDRLIDSRGVDGVNLQFGAGYAARTVQRMTAQQYSSPLRVKGKGVTR